MQSKVASFWELQEAAKTDGNATSVPQEAAAESTAAKPALSNFEVALARSFEHTLPTVTNFAESQDASPDPNTSAIDVLESELEQNTIHQ